MLQRIGAQAKPLPAAHSRGLPLIAPHSHTVHAAIRESASARPLSQRRRAAVIRARQSADAGGSGSGSGSASGSVGLFPAGKRQARVQLPALMLAVNAADVLDPDQLAGTLDDVGAAVAAGATAVVLSQGGDGGGGGELYEASVRLKDLLRGRAALLIADRTDIVDASGADGALLTRAGLPTVVAKRMLQDGLALVGRSVTSAEAAAEAAADGANFVVLEPSNFGGAAPNSAEAVAAQQQQRSSASIPVVAAITAEASRDQLVQLMAAGVDGLVLHLADLTAVAGVLTQQAPGSAADSATAILQRLSGSDPAAKAAAAEVAAPATGVEAPEGGTAEVAAVPGQKGAVQLSQLLSSSREELVDAERQLFTEVGGSWLASTGWLDWVVLCRVPNPHTPHLS